MRLDHSVLGIPAHTVSLMLSQLFLLIVTVRQFAYVKYLLFYNILRLTVDATDISVS